MAIPRQPSISADPALGPEQAGFHLPIVEQLKVDLDGAQKSRIEALALEIKGRDPRLAATAAFGQRVTSGLGPWPNLVFEDHCGISLYDLDEDRRYGYRGLLRAGQGDVFALAVDRNPVFEAYCRDTLGLGQVEIWTPDADGPPAPLALRCTADQRFLQRMARLAEEHRGLNLLPYLGNGKAWALARAIAERTDVEIRVAAPPPRLTKLANDKLWFEARVGDVLGPAALPEVRFADGPALLAHHVKDLASRYASVAIKLPASASSLGNIVMEAAEVSGRPLAALRETLCGLLARTGWRGEFPLLVTAWEQSVIASPSVHIWIPYPSENMPIVEGIFEQRLAGEERAFVGAVPSSLSSAVRRQLAAEAMQLAFLLQCLGYFGRCSFDAILLEDGKSGTRAHWVECNGRWGGVSIPMTLVNRLLGDCSRHPFVITQRSHLSGRPRPMADAIQTLGDRLFVAGKREEGAIVLTPGPLEAGTGFDLIVLADSMIAAENLAREIAVEFS